MCAGKLDGKIFHVQEISGVRVLGIRLMLKMKGEKRGKKGTRKESGRGGRPLVRYKKVVEVEECWREAYSDRQKSNIKSLNQE
jgi:ribulose 1,5-bisphosphate carboxylase large subunit-like protein